MAVKGLGVTKIVHNNCHVVLASAAALEMLWTGNPFSNINVAPWRDTSKVLVAQRTLQSCRQAARASALQIYSVTPKSLEPSQQKEKSRKIKTELELTVIRPQLIIKVTALAC